MRPPRMKQKLKACLAEGDFDGIREIATQRKSVLSGLLALTFDANEDIRWGAVEAIAVAASIWVEKDVEIVQNFCRHLLWMLNDESGNVGWFAPQSLGAVLAENHSSLPEFLPLFLAIFDEDNEVPILGGAIWALGRIGPIDDEFAIQAIERLRPHLDSNYAEIRDLAHESYQRFGKTPGVGAD